MISTALPPVKIKDAALAANVTEQTVRRWIKSGRLRAVKVGGRYRTTTQWIQELSAPVAAHADTVARGTKDDGYEKAVLSLRARFATVKAKKVPR
jgi:excisionase family DNA binding protein